MGQSAKLERMIVELGGLCGRGDLQRRWEVSSTRIAQITATEGFPSPICQVNGQSAYSLADAEQWRATRKPGRPRQSA